ncbi:hypothetical protein N5923_12740 [Erwiniaceae bacterium BAC15a-03b]|uniref:Uncharacterized protein n=1 Tax=Winslowiella arboricola TaxID=2978220 RepID=A0A9J6PS08_9GAMM|nr:hypothetical protein [Winslowiella arboricola]MCU5771927.1 hypothetical protein [Winslowiella arboricola]MCU5778360.1 hypothetical protein [Winslowiella arboricola]
MTQKKQNPRRKLSPLSLILPAIMLSGTTGLGQMAHAEDVLQYQPAVVTLEGDVDMQQFDGPPGYGDGPDDKKVYVPVLHLSAPVTVNPPPNTSNENADSEPENNVTEMQILSDHGPVKLNGCYRISGKLMHQVIADHYTTVLIIMDSAQPSTHCNQATGLP